MRSPEPMVFRRHGVLSGQPFTTSHSVAVCFGKNHKDLLCCIDSLLGALQVEEFGHLNFKRGIWYDETKKWVHPSCLLTRQGFDFLTMQFTQANELATRDAFFRAFETKEAEVILPELEQARREFERKGVAIAAWARDHKVSSSLVYQILAGKKKCHRGKSHKIAVLLGLKKCHRGKSHKIAVLLGLKKGEVVDSTAAVNDAERRAA